TQPEGQRLFNDPFAAMFVGTPLRRAVQWSAMPILGPVLGPVLRGSIDRFWPGARSSGVARTRLIDDWIGVRMANRAQQLVVHGAGFDSRAWRMPVLKDVPIFEVDQAATSAEKQRRAAAVVPGRSSVALVALDFDRGRLPDALAAAGFWRATVVWEGVTNYLT